MWAVVGLSVPKNVVLLDVVDGIGVRSKGYRESAVMVLSLVLTNGVSNGVDVMVVDGCGVLWRWSKRGAAC